MEMTCPKCGARMRMGDVCPLCNYDDGTGGREYGWSAVEETLEGYPGSVYESGITIDDGRRPIMRAAYTAYAFSDELLVLLVEHMSRLDARDTARYREVLALMERLRCRSATRNDVLMAIDSAECETPHEDREGENSVLKRRADEQVSF